MATITNISDELFRELNQPSELSIAAIAFWLQTNIGLLNTELGTSYTLSDAKEIVDGTTEIDINTAAIYKKLYLIHYYDRKIQENLGASSVSSLLEVGSDGATVRKVNKNEIAKTYVSMRKQAREELDTLINARNFGLISPVQVAGNDNVPETFIPIEKLNRLF